MELNQDIIFTIAMLLVIIGFSIWYTVTTDRYMDATYGNSTAAIGGTK